MKKNAWIILFAVFIILLMILSLTNVINDTLGMSLAFGLFIVFALLIARNAHAKDIKLVEYVMIAFAIVTAILAFLNLRTYFKIHANNYKFQIVVEKDTSEKRLMFTHNGKNYYTYNLKSVSVIMKEKEERLTLQDALNSEKITLDEILDLAVPNIGTNGYKMYYDGGQKKYDNDEYSIVVCENNNIIFSTFDYKYDANICN